MIPAPSAATRTCTEPGLCLAPTHSSKEAPSHLGLRPTPTPSPSSQVFESPSSQVLESPPTFSLSITPAIMEAMDWVMDAWICCVMSPSTSIFLTMAPSWLLTLSLTTAEAVSFRPRATSLLTMWLMPCTAACC